MKMCARYKIDIDIYRCGSLPGGLVFIEVGGLMLLLHIDQSATRDISIAFNAASRVAISSRKTKKKHKNYSFNLKNVSPNRIDYKHSPLCLCSFVL